MKVIIPYMACSLSLPYYIGDTSVVERQRERIQDLCSLLLSFHYATPFSCFDFQFWRCGLVFVSEIVFGNIVFFHLIALIDSQCHTELVLLFKLFEINSLLT